MWRCGAVLLTLWLLPQAALAQHGGSSNDAFALTELVSPLDDLNNYGNYVTAGHACRTNCVPVIDPAKKTLVLITAGASNGASVGPSAFVPTNLAAIDNFNIYDGGLYANLDPLLGQTVGRSLPGSIGPRLADIFVTNAIFDRVILVPVSVGSAQIEMYGNGGLLFDRGCVALRRLAVRGITASTPGVTEAMIWRVGENDFTTTQANWQALMVQQTAHLQACGFSGRIFINSAETRTIAGVNAVVAAAQAALVSSGAPYFAGANMDSLTGATNRQADGVHLTTVGQASEAVLEYNAMHASGAPF